MISGRQRSMFAIALALLAGFSTAISLHAGTTARNFTRLQGSFENKTSATDPVIGADGRIGVMIVLEGEPAAVAFRRALTAGGGRGPVAQAAAGVASRQVVSQLQARQATFVQAVHARHIEHDELFRAQRVSNGVAMRVAPAEIKLLASLPGVVSVKFLPLERPSNITSVPFINAPEVWKGFHALGLPADATGEGVRVGIIDTGIDYQHPDFGGSGALKDYQKNADRTHVNSTYFPTAKVVGGMDFVGDQYNGANNPVPDPNPMDCNGHGTHVAGTVAGFGVKTDGTPYSKGYDPLPDFANFRIGPGVAPGAQLYALRVFGCGGGTSVLAEAMEWAMDPNNDGDLSDHLDVINMSLGSPLGFPSDVDAVAADTAAQAGVIVVAASGNDGDAFFTSGSPASGRHVISVAAIVDSGIPGVLVHESAPANAEFAASTSSFVNPDNSSPPAPSGQSASIVLVNDDSASPAEGCSATYLNDVAGKIALIDRGDCAFTDKVINAQSNGAIGVIVADDQDGAVPVTMGGGAAVAITIPAISVSNVTGAQLKAQLPGPVTVALKAANAGDTFAAFSSRGPVGDFDGSLMLKPDLAAPGLSIPSAQSGVTCTFQTGDCLTPANGGFLPGGQLLVLSGTSMATPHVAGMMAILRQVYPSATADELKAIAMNTASHDVTVGANGSGPHYGARSVGSGRVDVAQAATNAISLSNDDVAGATSVTFDVEPTTSAVTTHHVRITNHSDTEQVVDLALRDIDEAPGVQFSVAGPATIPVPASGSMVVTVEMTPDPAHMKRLRDPTIPATSTLSAQGFTVALPRSFLSEKSSLLRVSQGGVERARLPIYAATRPHSSITGALAAPVASTATSLDVSLSGTGLCTGAVVAGPACVAAANDETSLVSAFELQLDAPRDNTLPGFANVHYVGVNYLPDANGDLLLFGLATYGKWTTPDAVAYNICIDTDGDGNYDKILYNTDFGSLRPLLGAGPPAPSDAYLSVVSNVFSSFFEAPLNLIDAQTADTAVLSNNVMLLAAFAPDLGVTPASKITYGVAVCPSFDPQCARVSIPSNQCTAGDALASFNGPYSYDIAHPGIDGKGNVLLQDLDGATVSMPYNEGNLAANGSRGLLLLHHHNTSDKSAQVVVVDDIFSNGVDAPAN